MSLDLTSFQVTNLFTVRDKWVVITGGGTGECLQNPSIVDALQASAER
jgi:hypothetical protein